MGRYGEAYQAISNERTRAPRKQRSVHRAISFFLRCSPTRKRARGTTRAARRASTARSKAPYEAARRETPRARARPIAPSPYTAGMMDPSMFYSIIFGSEGFEAFVGELQEGHISPYLPISPHISPRLPFVGELQER